MDSAQKFGLQELLLPRDKLPKLSGNCCDWKTNHLTWTACISLKVIFY